MYLIWSAAAGRFNTHESSIRTIAKKEKGIHGAVTAAMPAGTKTLPRLRNSSLSHIEDAAFL